VRVFCELFERRAGAKTHIPIAPLDDYLKWATLKIAAHRVTGDVLCDVLDNIFVVNVSGDVFTRPFAYKSQFCLGNINTASMPEMIASETYRSCRHRILGRKLGNCAACEHRGFCDSSPMHEHGSVTDDADGARCVVTRRAIQEIESELVAAGVDRAVIVDWARDRVRPNDSSL
jgi:radical SAM protein with 4Fe4S-binding SPASM domain